jgi:NAD(P)-dependent dehydrogenase (short-subunit alcohol dehydrogenase family)
VTKPGDCNAFVERCVKTYKRIDILHNNVGIVRTGGPVEVSEETWDLVMDTNIKSIYLTCRYVLPYMEEQGAGSIVNISSIAGISVPYAAITYSASKAAIIALTRDIAIQYASKGIRANAILPGYLNTPMVIASLTQTFGGSVDDMIKRRDAMIPMGKQGDAWDVAYAALFLASDEAKFITATTLIIDGGQTAKLYSG